MEASKDFPVSFADVQPFTGETMPQTTTQDQAVLAEATVQREIAEVQAAMMIAKRYPRNQIKAFDRIMVACERPSLAEKALYSYARGGTEITGPSIRLAEAIGQQWGNLQFGIRELDQRIGESTVEAYAWDLETNTRQSKVFQVKHFRYTRKGSYNLEDPRDIYEMVANQGARRLRACILGVIPGDVVDAAVEQCEATLKAKADITPQAIQKMLGVFNEMGVSKEQLEARIQRNLETITAAQVISLRKIYNSLRDGMSKPQDWFDEFPEPPAEVKQPEPTQSYYHAKAKRGRKPKEKSEPAVSPSPPPENATTVISELLTPDQGREIESLLKDPAIIDSGYSLQTLCYEWEVADVEELNQEQAANVILRLKEIQSAAEE